MRDGRRVLWLAAAIVGLLAGAVLLLVPPRPAPAPGPVAEIVVGESAGPPVTVVEDPPTATSVPEVVPGVVPEVVPPPAPIVGDDDDLDDDLDDDDLGDDDLGDDDDDDLGDDLGDDDD